jgi:hypothetical protein
MYCPLQHVYYIQYCHLQHLPYIFLGIIYQILPSTADTIYCMSSTIGTIYCIVFYTRLQTVSSIIDTSNGPLRQVPGIVFKQQAQDIVLNSRHKTLSSIAGTRHRPQQQAQDIVLNSRHKTLSSIAGTRQCLNSKHKTVSSIAGTRHCPQQQEQGIVLDSRHNTLSSTAGTRHCSQ